MATRTCRRRNISCGSAAILVWLASLSIGVAPAASDPSTDGVAFIEVFGDASLDENTNDWVEPRSLEDVRLATGSGFVVAPSGLILTNHHVIASERRVRRLGGVERELALEVKRLDVSVWQGGRCETYEATVVASDPDLDLAALQVTAVDMHSMPLGDSDAAVPGQRLTVVGFPFGDAVEVGRSDDRPALPAPTVTGGSFSAMRLDDEGQPRFLQTDASINPGSSGGPILDETGYVLGVVSMKLSSRRREGDGAGFGVPINRVKDFLESAGVLFQVPGQRLTMVTHDLGWKGLQVALVDGMEDRSPKRVLVDTGPSVGGVAFMAVRFRSAGSARELEGQLLQNRIVPGFAPVDGLEAQRRHASERRILGSARRDRGRRARIWLEYAILEVGPNERVAARFVGPAENVAFNLGSLRRALETLAALPLLTGEVLAAPPLSLEGASVGSPPVAVRLPSGWSREPANRAGCTTVPKAPAGIAASPEGDFTVVLRVLRWHRSEIDPYATAQACGQPSGSPALAYARNGRRLGAHTAIWGSFQTRGDEVLLFEAEAPQRKLPLLSGLYVEWTRAGAERAHESSPPVGSGDAP